MRSKYPADIDGRTLLHAEKLQTPEVKAKAAAHRNLHRLIPGAKVGGAPRKPRAVLSGEDKDFCLRYLQTGNASKSFRDSHPDGSNNRQTVFNGAKRALQRQNVINYIKELGMKGAERNEMTLASHLSDLADLRDKAAAAKKFDAAVKAEQLRGETAGFYIERRENGTAGAFANKTRDELVKEAQEKYAKLGLGDNVVPLVKPASAA